jgi:ribonuclease HI
MEPIKLHTDGSCHAIHRIGGWACIITLPGKTKILEGYHRNTTHQRMELTAVIEGLTFLRDHKLNSLPVQLFTDSQYVTMLPLRRKGIESADYLTSKNILLPNADILKTFFGLMDTFAITIHKVKAHQKSGAMENLNRVADLRCRKIVREQVRGLLQR